jgi:hypothetical protein
MCQSPEFISPAGPDGVLGFDSVTGIDDGLDDDFHLQNGSPAVAAGDPSSDDSAQPAPTGGRINLGAYGDTAQATTTASAGVIVDQTAGFKEVVNGGTDGDGESRVHDGRNATNGFKCLIYSKSMRSSHGDRVANQSPRPPIVGSIERQLDFDDQARVGVSRGRPAPVQLDGSASDRQPEAEATARAFP